MKLSVSKTWKSGPFNLTASKSGFTGSVGVPGFRLSINTKGEVGIRVGKKGFSFNKKKKII